MVKCPNCGSITGVSLIDTEVYVWHDIIFVYITYKCKCGRGFVTKTQVEKEGNEIMYMEET